jgi:hypothetical protein
MRQWVSQPHCSGQDRSAPDSNKFLRLAHRCNVILNEKSQELKGRSEKFKNPLRLLVLSYRLTAIPSSHQLFRETIPFRKEVKWILQVPVLSNSQLNSLTLRKFKYGHCLGKHSFAVKTYLWEIRPGWQLICVELFFQIIASWGLKISLLIIKRITEDLKLRTCMLTETFTEKRIFICYTFMLLTKTEYCT